MVRASRSHSPNAAPTPIQPATALPSSAPNIPNMIVSQTGVARLEDQQGLADDRVEQRSPAVRPAKASLTERVELGVRAVESLGLDHLIADRDLGCEARDHGGLTGGVRPQNIPLHPPIIPRCG
jgi:hypothetical protein